MSDLEKLLQVFDDIGVYYVKDEQLNSINIWLTIKNATMEDVSYYTDQLIEFTKDGKLTSY